MTEMNHQTPPEQEEGKASGLLHRLQAVFSKTQVPGIKTLSERVNTQRAKELALKADAWIEAWNPYDPKKLANKPLRPVEVEESEIRKTASKYFLITFGVFTIWAFFAPIDAGVTVPGTVIVSGNRKAVQHPTGGVIKEILVKEGDKVSEGDVLFVVNPLNAEANLSTVELQYINALAMESRLKAERAEAKEITWSPDLDAIPEKDDVAEAKQTQEKLFNTRRKEFSKTIAARKTQLGSLAEEQRNLTQLAKEGYVPKNQASLALRNMLETETTLNAFEANYFKQIDTELADVQKNRDALHDKYVAAQFERDLSKIKAPTSGTVVGLKVFTVGGVITASEMLAEVVPDSGVLVVSAKIPDRLIDKVKVGENADLHFTAFNANTTPTVPGLVKVVGADLVVPQKGKQVGEPEFEYYPAQIETTEEGQKMLGDLQIQPGMPVEVVIKTGERTFVSYLLKPITDRTIKAFKN